MTTFSCDINSPFKFNFDDQKVNRTISAQVLSAGISLTAALALAISTYSTTEISNVAIAISNILISVSFEQQTLLLPVLFNVCDAIRYQTNDPLMNMFLHLMVVKIVVPLSSPYMDIAKKYLMFASSIAQKHINCRHIYMKFLLSFARNFETFLERLESANNCHLLNAMILIEKHSSKMMDVETLQKLSHLLIKTQEAKCELFIPVNFLKINLAKLAFREGRSDVAILLLRSISKFSLKTDSNYVTTLFRLVRQEVLTAQATQATIQNICDSLAEARKHYYPDLTLHASVQLWNALLDIMDNRQDTLRVIKLASEALQELVLPCENIKLFFFRELSACYEKLDLLSLALVYAKRSMTFTNDKNTKDELQTAVLRIEMKLRNPIEGLSEPQKSQLNN